MTRIAQCVPPRHALAGVPRIHAAGVPSLSSGQHPYAGRVLPLLWLPQAPASCGPRSRRLRRSSCCRSPDLQANSMTRSTITAIKNPLLHINTMHRGPTITPSRPTHSGIDFHLHHGNPSDNLDVLVLVTVTGFPQRSFTLHGQRRIDQSTRYTRAHTRPACATACCPLSHHSTQVSQAPFRRYPPGARLQARSLQP